MDEQDDDVFAVVGLGFLVFLFFPFFLINFGLYLSQTMVLPPVEIHGKIGNTLYFEYPTNGFPLTCFFPELSHVNSSIPMIFGFKENQLLFQMPPQDTQLHLIYRCKPFYNMTTTLNLYPEKQGLDPELAFWIVFFLVLFLFLGSYIFVLFSWQNDERKKRTRPLFQ